MGRNSNVAVGGGLIIVLVWILGVIGYIMNLWKCISGFLDAKTIGEVLVIHWVQLVGVFTGPIGSIMGWFIW